jgi:hypothetical protein
LRKGDFRPWKGRRHECFVTIVRELISLFIDDGSFALAIVAWVFAAAVALRAGVDPILASLILFAGLAVLLAENVWRSVGEIRSRR